jgi:hypothetical protein
MSSGFVKGRDFVQGERFVEAPEWFVEAKSGLWRQRVVCEAKSGL